MSKTYRVVTDRTIWPRRYAAAHDDREPRNASRPLFGDKAGNAWALLQERTDAYLDPLGRAAMALLDVERGARVIDVGCGCGQTLLELAELVGPSGQVLGLDISEPMLARAREQHRAAPERLVGAGRRGDPLVPAGSAGRPSFLVSASCSFAIPKAAFTNLRRALRPGGQLAFVCWQELSRNPWAEIPLRA